MMRFSNTPTAIPRRAGTRFACLIAAALALALLFTAPAPASAQQGTTYSDILERIKRQQEERRKTSSSKESTPSPETAGRASGTAAGGTRNVTTPGGLPDAGRKRTVVGRTAPRRSVGGGGATAAPLPTITYMQGTKDDTLYLSPPQSEVAEGDRFATRLDFYIVDTARIGSFDIWLKYDPAFLEPTWVDVAAIEDNVSSGVVTDVWRDRGFVRIKGELKTPLSDAINPIAEVHWRAIEPTPATRIELVAPEGQAVAMWDGNRNVVATSNIGNRSRVSSRIKINSAGGGEAPALRMARDVLDQMTTADLESTTRMRLAIVPAKPLVATGEVSTADVVLINPTDQPFDHLQFLIRYDPSSVQILDADQNNYITKGINIFDGDFHARFPFDFLGEDAVDPSLGVIRYSMGTMAGAAHFGAGTVARIVYRMKRDAGTAAFWFERSDPLRGSVATDVTANGVSLLGHKDAVAATALHGTRVMVQPLDLRAEATARP